MNKAKGIVILFVIALLLSACQPTPEETVIVNKNDGKLEEKLYASQPPDETTKPYEAPAHWSETVRGEKLTIVIDTDVKLPNVSRYPVVKLEPVPFTQQQVDDMVNYFTAGKKLYLPHVMTKSDYEKMIIEAKRGEEINGKYVVTENSKRWLKGLQEDQAAAPDDSAVIYTNTTLTYSRDYETGEEDIAGGKNFLNVRVENGDGHDGSIGVQNYAAGYNGSTHFSYSSGYTDLYTYESEYKLMMREATEEESGFTGTGVLFDKVKIKKEDAQRVADKVIADLGIKDLALVTADKAVSRDYPDKGGYWFEYMRESGGIPGYRFRSSSWSNYEPPPEYIAPFGIESLSMLITEDGVQYFGWGGCAKVIETVNDNVELLPFDKIQKRLIDQVRFKKSFDQLDGLKDNTINIISAELRVGYIGVKDNPGQMMLVPVWAFESEFTWYNTVVIGDTYMLNAIDGVVIEEKRPDSDEMDSGYDN